jgi:hypothetical protein
MEGDSQKEMTSNKQQEEKPISTFVPSRHQRVPQRLLWMLLCPRTQVLHQLPLRHGMENEGNFLGASSIVIDGVTDPEIAKAVARREGLALSNDLAFAEKLDSQVTVPTLSED